VRRSPAIAVVDIELRQAQQVKGQRIEQPGADAHAAGATQRGERLLGKAQVESQRTGMLGA
jgi:hypothetical protein